MEVTTGWAEDEQGRELMADELIERTVIILQKEGRPMVTTWVARIGSDYVVFHSDVIKTTLILKRNPDGTMEDDSQTRIRAYEYLGEI